MNVSKHLKVRMQQRSISKAELDIVMAFGDVNGDKVFLNKQRTEELLKQFSYYLKQSRRN